MIMKNYRLILLLIFTITFISCKQKTIDNDKIHVKNVSMEISNQNITCFEEDGLGQIWIGTWRGLNKYVGQTYYQYFYDGNDSTSIPDNQIHSLLNDSHNRLWIGTASSICYRTDKDNFHRVSTDGKMPTAQQFREGNGKIFCNMVDFVSEYDSVSDRFVMVIPNFNLYNDYFTLLLTDNNGNLWGIGTHTITEYKIGTFAKCFQKRTDDMITSADIDSKKRIWMAINGHIQLMDSRSAKFISLPTELNTSKLPNTVYSIKALRNDVMLIQTQVGGYEFNIKTNKLSGPINLELWEKANFTITTVFADSKKNLWVGTSDQSFYVKYRNKNKFNFDFSLIFSLFHKSVSSISTCKDGSVWIATARDGLFYYNSREKNGVSQVVLPFNKEGQNIVKTFVSADDDIWLATTNGIIYHCSHQGGHLALKEKFYVPAAPLAMTETSDGTIFFTGYNPYIFRLKKGATSFERFLLVKGKFSFTTSLLKYKGNLMASSFDEDIKIINPRTMKVVHEIPFKNIVRHGKVIPNCIYQDSRGAIWIGTISNGLYRIKGDSVKAIGGTTCLDISSIEEDENGDLWISTADGLSKMNHKTGQFTSYFSENGTGGNQFNDRSSALSADGTMFFGGTHGLTFFIPKKFGIHRKLKVLFENLKVYDKNVYPTDGCMDKDITLNPVIRLNHNQRSFSVAFAVVDYSEQKDMQYYYKIEDYDKYWIKAGPDHTAQYSNLPPGEYTLKVKITTGGSDSPIAENSITICVSPAPWLAWWAKILYFLLACLLVAYFIRARKRINEQKKLAEKEKMEKEAEWETNKMNMRFFSNASHEFRTPLTMIAGPVNTLSMDKRLSIDQRQLLQIVKRSVNRMLRLVNQMLDFQKLESDVVRVETEYADIIAQINEIIEIFKINAEEKGIILKTSGLDDKYMAWFDSDKVESIISNLLSNAMKFTPQEGTICISFDVDENNMKIAVSDTGAGIPDDKKEDIFRRYYQIEKEKTVQNWGTGIGLYYSHRLAEIHHGKIVVGDNPGGGSVFTLLLPISADAYLDSEKKKVNTENKQTAAFKFDNKPITESANNNDTDISTILVVDDDIDVANYIKTCLSPHFHVEITFSAKAAYMSLDDIKPDVIVSDVLMPDVDGFQFCRMIKQNIAYSHIPVILLTAKSMVDDQIRGLHDGANAYVTKPFESEYLIALIQSQLRNNENLRHALEKATKTDGLEQGMSYPDTSFMRELYALMDKKLSDSELNINAIISELHIARSKFYYKMKGLTGMTPNEFFKTYKLNRAAELIVEGKYNISEIADITGFSTLSHFSNSFKKHFGVTPSDYKG